MKTSTYKKWMSVGLLTEEDILNKKIKDKDHPEGVLVKTALDDPKHTLHKKAKAMVDAGDGKSDDDTKDKEKKQTKIDTNPYDDKKPSDEPKGDPESQYKDALKKANDLANSQYDDQGNPNPHGASNKQINMAFKKAKDLEKKIKSTNKEKPSGEPKSEPSAWSQKAQKVITKRLPFPDHIFYRCSCRS